MDFPVIILFDIFFKRNYNKNEKSWLLKTVSLKDQQYIEFNFFLPFDWFGFMENKKNTVYLVRRFLFKCQEKKKTDWIELRSSDEEWYQND